MSLLPNYMGQGPLPSPQAKWHRLDVSILWCRVFSASLMMQLYSKVLIICYVCFFSTGCLKVCELCATAHLRARQPGIQYECLWVLVPGLLAQPWAALQGKVTALGGSGHVSCWEQSQRWAISWASAQRLLCGRGQSCIRQHGSNTADQWSGAWACFPFTFLQVKHKFLF